MKLNMVFEYLGYASIIISIISSSIYTFRQYRSYRNLSDRWQKIKGKWYSYSITYQGNKKEVTGYEWNFKYNFWKGYTGNGKSLKDETVTYKNVKLNFKRDYIFMTAEGGHSGENIFGIMYEDYPIDVTQRIKAFMCGLSYNGQPLSTEAIFTKEKPDLEALNKKIAQLEQELRSIEFELK